MQGEHYINISANCVTCGSNWIGIGILEKQPQENESVIFDFTIWNSDETCHQDVQTKKRQGSQARTLATSQNLTINLQPENYWISL